MERLDVCIRKFFRKGKTYPGGLMPENYTFSAIKSHFLQRQCFYKDFLILLSCTKFFMYIDLNSS
jgi:hypothetical protein